MINFNSTTPIYLQFVKLIKYNIISGKLEPGSKMESVRGYAEIYKINPNTVQKGFVELEEEGIVESNRTMGRNVTTNLELIKKLREEALNEVIDEAILNLTNLAFSKQEILSSFEGKLKE